MIVKKRRASSLQSRICKLISMDASPLTLEMDAAAQLQEFERHFQNEETSLLQAKEMDRMIGIVFSFKFVFSFVT